MGAATAWTEEMIGMDVGRIKISNYFEKFLSKFGMLSLASLVYILSFTTYVRKSNDI